MHSHLSVIIPHITLSLIPTFIFHTPPSLLPPFPLSPPPSLPPSPHPTRGQKEAVLVSSRPLYNNELFEVELGNEAESMVSSSGSIKRKKTTAGAIRVGVTGHR